MTSRTRPRSVVERVDWGIAELVPDPRRRGGWTLYIDDAAQSYVCLPTPTHLEFTYARRLASVIDAAAPAGHPLRVLHLGGGAMTLPRFVAATRPGSRQDVIESDRKLYTLIRRHLPVTADGIKVRIADARDAVAAAAADEFDLVIADAYQGERIAPELTTERLAAEAARILRPGGMYAVNIVDAPPFVLTRTIAVAAQGHFADTCLLADADIDRDGGQRNVILVAITGPGSLPLDQLARATTQSPRGRLLHGSDLNRAIGQT
ncbi:spermidine synthase [Catellatospora coxensis]|uniref:Spermine/spermidine synthase n=1 Tax=Catellatospora coxensis TaxID=310354 RepID=A0A8J3KPC5_9ACTN|nr:hypothetical protein Cco03nite_05080 [Catellatospora coxensis]